MVSLLWLSVLLSGVLQSCATINLNSSAFKNKLQTLPASIPVYIILSNGYNASISDVRSTLNEVGNSGGRTVYLYEIFGTAVPLSTRSECLNRNSRATGSAAVGKPRTNQSNIRTLEMIKNLITSRTDPRPILVVSIYSEFNLKQVKYIKCWIRDVLSGRRLIVSKVKYQDSALPKTVDSSGSTTTPSVEKEKSVPVFSRNRPSNTLKPSATEKPAVESESEVDSSDSGTVFWVSSGFASKPNSGLLTRRSTSQGMKDRNERSISFNDEDSTAQNLPPDLSGSTGAKNMKTYGENTQDDCQLRDTCAFSFSQSRKKVESVEPSPNLHRTELTSGVTNTNIELTTDDLHASGPSLGHKIHEERVDSSRKPSRFDGWSYSKQDNIVNGGTGYEKPTLISSSEENTKEESSDRNSLKNYPATERSTVKKLKIPPIDPILDDVREGSDNLYKLNYDINKWPVIDKTVDVSNSGIQKVVDVSKSGIQKIVENVKGAARSSVNKIKSGFRRLKEFGNDSYHKFINFFS